MTKTFIRLKIFSDSYNINHDHRISERILVEKANRFSRSIPDLPQTAVFEIDVQIRPVICISLCGLVRMIDDNTRNMTENNTRNRMPQATLKRFKSL